MSLRLLHLLGASLVIVTALYSGPHASVAFAVTPSGQVAADQAQLGRALARLESTKARVRRIEQRSEAAAQRLDATVAKQERLQQQLSSRVDSMYRTGETPFLAVLMNAATYEDFVSSWALLGRVNRRDAALLRKLAASRRASTQAAETLMQLQTQAAKEVDAQRREVARARAELASSNVTLVIYQQRVRSAVRPRSEDPVSKKTDASPKPAPKDPVQKRSGTGAWRRAVASHYGRNFTGRGASGARIGPYSMIVAHKTLPFGTLVEFRYNGKRAVARVADRGPYTQGRTFDLGPGVIRVLGFSGVHPVQYRVIGR